MVEFVDQQVDGCVYVFMFCIGYDFVIGDVQGGFDFLFQFFDFYDYLNIGDFVEMVFQMVQFFVDIVVQGVGYIQLMVIDVDLYIVFFLLFVCKWQVSNLFLEYFGVD